MYIREVGVLRVTNHKTIFVKANINSPLFNKVHEIRRREAGKLYWRSTAFQSIPDIKSIYQLETNLSLEDIFTAFNCGKWDKNGRCSYGGHKWAEITHFTLNLGVAISGNDILSINQMLNELKNLKHNNGPITAKFGDLKKYKALY